MIAFTPTEAPEGFDRDVRDKGNKWLAAHPTGRPKDYWNEYDNKYKFKLADAFADLCAYSAQKLNQPGTVDHFVSIKEDRSRAYDWKNYRYAAGWLNSSKQSGKKELLSTQILDPFEVQDGWFEMHLPSLQVCVTDAYPPELREKANFTLDRLHLRDDERLVRFRRSWLKKYQAGRADLDLVEEHIPLLGRALRNQEQASSTTAEQ